MRFFPIIAFVFAVALHAQTPLTYTPLTTPCRAVDTRTNTTPIQGGTTRDFSPFAGGCNIPLPTDGSQIVYAVNATVVPHGDLNYITVWPAGEAQPTGSLLNSYDGRTKANAALVTGGTEGQISVFASNTTDFVLDVSGYFTDNLNGLVYVPIPPCRIIDTRNGTGGPVEGLEDPLVANTSRTWDIAYPISIDDTPPGANHCNLPYNVGSAYSVNVTVVPINNAPVWFTSVWGSTAPPLAPNTEPPFSNVNAYTGTDTANAAIINGPLTIAAFSDVTTDLVVDVTGWFAPASVASEGMSLYSLPPCRALDTRLTSTEGLVGITEVPVNPNENCPLPTGLPTPQAFVLNATVVPTSAVGYLTLWPAGQAEPVVSTLNANDGIVTSNMAIVGVGPLSSNNAVEAIQAQASTASKVDLILDESAMFAHNPVTQQPTVVFIGDETTANWNFAGHPNWINKGVAGNTTDQMLARFQTDVINLHPAVVHIMGGWNDVLTEEWGDVSQCGPDACQNLQQMAQMAQAAGIKVIVGSPLQGNGSVTANEQADLDDMNRLLRENYCLGDWPVDYIDYYDAQNGTVPTEMTAMVEAQVGMVAQ